ncbi:U3 small nucleolar RNA-associated protein NOL7 isoform X2 [Amia ocellicauda]|uniref:U3 small nucleolar RNA-associated protein NOL7 isoform X2 n=1 Tax=Amia ocellicauda TaxID=2972642 RepID=UPI003464D12C
MAKRQHGKLCSAPTRRSARNRPQEESMDIAGQSSGDEEAPEEVTFEESKAAAAQSLKDSLEAIRRNKEHVKKIRRERQEMFKEQKKRKLLPEDLLEEIDSSIPGKPKTTEIQEKEENGDDQDEAWDSEESQGASEKEDKRKAKSRLRANFKVVRVKDQKLANAKQTSGIDFINSRLYRLNSNRTTPNQLLSLQNKTAENKSAAVEFISKSWASQKKTRADTFKKRWIHKQRVEDI